MDISLKKNHARPAQNTKPGGFLNQAMRGAACGAALGSRLVTFGSEDSQKFVKKACSNLAPGSAMQAGAKRSNGLGF